MARTYSQLEPIDHHPITPATHREFLRLLETCLLLALKEQGLLTDAQCRHAQQGLREEGP